jgi:hypothetical protein
MDQLEIMRLVMDILNICEIRKRPLGCPKPCKPVLELFEKANVK